MKITVVALGKIGLPLAVQFASKGHEVIGADVNPTTVEQVNAGIEPFPGEAFLGEKMRAAVDAGVHLLDGRRVHVGSDHLVTLGRELHGEREADLAQGDDGDLHGEPLLRGGEAPGYRPRTAQPESREHGTGGDPPHRLCPTVVTSRPPRPRSPAP